MVFLTDYFFCQDLPHQHCFLCVNSRGRGGLIMKDSNQESGHQLLSIAKPTPRQIRQIRPLQIIVNMTLPLILVETRWFLGANAFNFHGWSLNSWLVEKGWFWWKLDAFGPNFNFFQCIQFQWVFSTSWFWWKLDILGPTLISISYPMHSISMVIDNFPKKIHLLNR